MFIASRSPASLEEKISSSPKQKISNIFIDHGPIPNTDIKLSFKVFLFNFDKSLKLLFKYKSETSFIVFALFVLSPSFLICSIIRNLKLFSFNIKVKLFSNIFKEKV